MCSPCAVVKPSRPSRPNVPDLLASADSQQAVQIAHTYKHRVELSAKETERSTTFVNPDGTFSEEVSTTPVRVRINDSWVAPDASWQETPAGPVRPKAAIIDASLSSDPALSFLTVKAGGGSIDYRWPSVLPKPTLHGNEATYADVFPGVDLRVDLSVENLHVSLAVKSKAAKLPASIDFPFALQGLSGTSTDGVLRITDPTGLEVARGVSPLAWDSSVGEHSGGPVNVPLESTLTKGHAVAQVTAWSQSVVTPRALLDDPKTVYPVIIDPPMSVAYSATGAAYIDSQFASTSYDPTWDANRIHVGKNPSGTGVTRSYLQFARSSQSANLAGTDIISATLATNEVYAWSCTAKSMQLTTASPWSSTISWNNQPIMGSVIGTATVAYGYSTSCPAVANTPAFNVTTAVAGQLSQNYSAFSFGIRATDETDATAWKKFSTTATLTVQYNTPPNVPTNLKFSSPQAACASALGSVYLNNAVQALYLSANVSDPDAGNSSAFFRVVSLGTGHTVWSGTTVAAPDGQQEIAVPINALPEDNYVWQVNGVDDQGATSAVTSNCYFTINNTPPSTPQIKMNGSQIYSPTAINTKTGNPATVQFSQGAAGDGVTRYGYSFDGTPPVQPPAGDAGYFVPLAGRVVVPTSVTAGHWTRFTMSGFQPVAGGPQVPAAGSVTAVAVSIEVISPTVAGTLSAAPDSSSLSDAQALGTSVIYGSGTTGSISNSAVVQVGTTGKIALRTTSAVQLLVDIQGYYTSTSADTPGGFTPITQKRISSLSGVASGSTTDVAITGASGIPTGASAAVLCFTVVNNASAPAGYITAYSSATRPGTGLAFTNGSTMAMTATVPLDAAGHIKVYLSTIGYAASILIHVQGYFSATTDDGAFHPVTGTNFRAFDSRVAPNVAVRPYSRVKVTLANMGGVPAVGGAGIAGVVANYQVTNATQTGYIRVGFLEDPPEAVSALESRRRHPYPNLSDSC